MTVRSPRVNALTLRPLEGLLLAGGETRWAHTAAQAELLLRRLASQLPPDAPGRRFEVCVQFAGGARVSSEVALTRDDAERETSRWEDVLLSWARRDRADGEAHRARLLSRLAELVRHVAHQRAVGERVDAHEDLDRKVDSAGEARRLRLLARPPPADLVGRLYRPRRPLEDVARNVRRDIVNAVSQGLLPERLRCTVEVETFEAGPGVAIEVVNAPGLWIPDVCEMCLPIAFGLGAPAGGPTCGHTPSRTGYSLAAHGVLLTLLAIGDVYNGDAGRVEGAAYVVESAFELATSFCSTLDRAQRETLRSSEQALQELARRRASQSGASPGGAPPGGSPPCVAPSSHAQSR